MARKTQKRSRRLMAVADPDTIAAFIQRRGHDGPPPRFRFDLCKPLNPADLLATLIRLHNFLNSRGPTEEWDALRRYLFCCVENYKLQLAREDDSSERVSRTAFIQAGYPMTRKERADVAQALTIKKEIASQVKTLKAKNIWW